MQDKTKQYCCCFFFNFFQDFIQLCDSRKIIIHYLTREFRVKLHLKTDIYSSLRDSCDIGFCVQCNADFPRQVMNFATEFSLTKPANKPLSRNVKQDNGCHENTAVVWQTKCANLRFQRHRQREQTTVILSFSTFHSTVLLPVHFSVQYWVRAKSNNCEMVTIVEMFVFKCDIFAAITAVVCLYFYALGAYANAGIQNRNRNSNRGKLGNTDQKVVRQWNLSRYMR